jgi:hypothetical protein
MATDQRLLIAWVVENGRLGNTKAQHVIAQR